MVNLVGLNVTIHDAVVRYVENIASAPASAHAALVGDIIEAIRQVDEADRTHTAIQLASLAALRYAENLMWIAKVCRVDPVEVAQFQGSESIARALLLGLQNPPG